MMTTFAAPLVALALLTVPATVVLAGHDGAHAYEQTAKLWPPPSQGFGVPLSADEQLLAVGPDPVQVYEYTRTGWARQEAIETPTEAFPNRTGHWGTANGRCFGHDVALDSHAGVLAIGDPCLDVPGNVSDHERDAGAVYVYEREPDASWTLAERFLGPVNGDWNDQASSGNDNLGPWMGFSVAVYGDTIVAGAPAAVVDGTPLAGKVDVYERGDDGTWTRILQTISPLRQAEMWDQFGFGVDVANGRIAVGAPGEAAGLGSGAGTVHLYEHDEESWIHDGRLSAPLVHAGDRTFSSPVGLANVPTGASFGEAVAFDDDATTLGVGSSWGNRLAGLGLPTSTDFDTGGIDGVLTNPWGTAYIFDHTGESFKHTASLEHPDREAHSGFGRDLAVDAAGDTIVVGAPLAHQSEAFVSVNGQTVGTPPPVSDHGVVTHHPATGAAYVFERTASWECSAQLSGDDTDAAGPGPTGDDSFGIGVAITGATTWVGAPNNGDDNRRTIYAFEASGPTFSLPAANSHARCGPR